MKWSWRVALALVAAIALLLAVGMLLPSGLKAQRSAPRPLVPEPT